MDDERNQPLSGNAMPRFAGLATMMRLPAATSPQGLDAAFIGVPLDIGTSNRAGARFGPRQMRAESALLRPYNMATGAAPFDTLQVADLGDVPINTYSIDKSLAIITSFYDAVLGAGCTPLTLGGDHTIALPILRSIAKKHGPVALVHVDAHADINDDMFGERVTHGTPFRRAVEEGLLDPKRTVQIGIRGSLYAADDLDWALAQGMRVITIEEYFKLGTEKVIAEARRVVGQGPTYISFDVDSLDPVYAPGTGTPEVGGFNTFEAQQMLRGLRGLDLIGGDVVEVSPPFDSGGTTALVGATMMFEILCVLAEALAARRGTRS
jgi:guanidinobutyrase